MKSRDYGFDPEVRDYVDNRFAEMDLSEEQIKQLYMLFIPLSRNQFMRLLPQIEILVSRLEGDIQVNNENTNPRLSIPVRKKDKLAVRIEV